MMDKELKKTEIPQLRPCIIYSKHEKPKIAFFHTWAIYAEPIAPSPLMGGHAGGQLEYPVAIVEFEDGYVTQVSPTTIRFTDREGVHAEN